MARLQMRRKVTTSRPGFVLNCSEVWANLAASETDEERGATQKREREREDENRFGYNR